MAENKKSFVLYSDLLKSIEHLTNEEKGILFNHLLEYVNDKNPILEDRLIITAWKPIELQLKRDLVKFEEVKAKRSDAGKRSAELRALKVVQQTSTNSTSVESVQQTSTNSTDNVNVNVNVNDNVNVLPKGNNNITLSPACEIIFSDLLKFYSASELNTPQKFFDLTNFFNTIVERNRFEYFSQNFRWFEKYQKLDRVKKFTPKYENFIGTKDHNYENGYWAKEDYKTKFESETTQRTTPTTTDNRFSTGTSVKLPVAINTIKKS